MLGWSLGFFVAAIVAAMFGFGVVASTFAGLALILFWVFIALFALSLVFGLARGGHGHVSTGFGGASMGLMALTAIVAVLAYAWVQNDWSAEKTGRAIDQSAAQITADASEALQGAGERAETLVDNTGAQLRHDTAQGLDNAQDAVEPDQRN